MLFILSGLLSTSLALTPAHVPTIRASSPRTALSTQAATAPPRTAPILLAEKEECGPDGRPTLAGEKVGVTVLLVAVAYGLGSAGVTPASILAAPTALFNNPIFRKAAKKAIGGGLSGALAGVCQVLTLMWLRTTMNYQYRYGGGIKDAMSALYKQGGIARFYQGVQFAIFQTPLSRFGDTAANTGVIELLAMTTWGVGLPIGIKTAMASAAGSLWRIAITPLDTLKTTLQVDGKAAYAQLTDKIKCDGPTVLYQGALANALASFVGSYPWFFAFNLAMRWLPAAAPSDLLFKLVRSAVAGVIASFISDIVSNFIRVLKTTRQTSATTIGYREAAQQIIDKDGVLGLFTRGLGTRVMTNAIQASLFTVVWKYLEGRMNA